jgi:pyruvate dehydrogenase E2 component (dihydrolipoamide acetyltransferase)
MPTEFRLQDPGEGIHEAEILKILVAEGDRVEEEQVVMEIETDKAAVEIPSPVTGMVKEISVSEGDVVQVGDVLMVFFEEGEDRTEEDSEDKKPVGEEKKVEEREEKQEDAEAGQRRQKKEAQDAAADKTEAGNDDQKEKAADKKKQIGDEEAPQEEEKGADKKPPEDRQPSVAEDSPSREGPVPATPATRRLARELKVDLRQVEPSGPTGRVTSEDVKAHAKQSEKKSAEKTQPEKAAPQSAPAEQPELPDFSQWGEVEEIPLRSVRRATAKRMSLSWSQVPQVTHQDVADITDLEAFRRENKAAETDDTLTLTVFAVKAAMAALKVHPRFNASLNSESRKIILKKYFHIGVAVDTDRGLLVPVVRDADCKSMLDLAGEIKQLAERTRQGELAPKDMSGGTFTITNVGPLGGTGFTPIINYPQVAILGLGQARLQPVIRGDIDNFEVVARLMLPLCLAFDHRVVDGADAARFMGDVIRLLENPQKLMLS